MSSTVSQMLSNRPLSEEHDDEVAVLEHRAGLGFHRVGRTSVAIGHPRWTDQVVPHRVDGPSCRAEVG